MNIKLKLLFRDRLGIVADISRIIAGQGLNIVSMEVERRNDQAHVSLEAEDRKRTGRKRIFEVLGKIPDLLEIRLIETLPHEERENRFRVVLDNVSDGVISIDRDGRITTINEKARRALCAGREVIGEDVKTLSLPGDSILECLSGKKFTHVKQDLITEGGRHQYFSTGRPIFDSSGHIIGAVEIAKDMQEIKLLARSISEPDQISFPDIIGQNSAIREAISFAQKIARTDSIVCLRGATGTGKEVFARAIHTASNRPGPFVPISCAALPEQLLESELFGYVGGAFTGSQKEGKPGLFEIARDGTLFLDEIAEMPLASQAKILRAIQEKCIRRIGGTEEIPVHARIVTATNQSLEQLVEQKLFRQDLYYRINVIPIHLPPLQERADDIDVLAEHFLFQLTSKLGKTVHSIDQEAMARLCRHNWPGNVRELKNVIERAAILCEEDTIGVGCILFGHEATKGIPPAAGPDPPEKKQRRLLRDSLSELEKKILSETLQGAKSVREAASSLGTSHTALLRKIKKLNIEWKQNGPGER